ncbi:uncharacterized protein TNCV_4252561 [Trichonephila clavipes]|nr:uncharacterized protein TNCV_4252561 [Trichonephila clavipes]
MTSCNHMCGHATPATAPRSHFPTRQCSFSYGKGVTRLSPHCYHPWPTLSPDLSPIEHIWDHLGWRVGHPTCLNELEASLQQIWSEMPQDIIQNFMPQCPIISLRARGGSTGY